MLRLYESITLVMFDVIKEINHTMQWAAEWGIKKGNNELANLLIGIALFDFSMRATSML